MPDLLLIAIPIASLIAIGYYWGSKTGRKKLAEAIKKEQYNKAFSAELNKKDAELFKKEELLQATEKEITEKFAEAEKKEQHNKVFSAELNQKDSELFKREKLLQAAEKEITEKRINSNLKTELENISSLPERVTAKKFLLNILSNPNHNKLPLYEKFFNKGYSDMVIDFLCDSTNLDLSDFNKKAVNSNIFYYEIPESEDDIDYDNPFDALYLRLEPYIKWKKFFYQNTSYALLTYRDEKDISLAALNKKYEILSEQVWIKRSHFLKKHPNLYVSWDDSELIKLSTQIHNLQIKNDFIDKVVFCIERDYN